MFSLLQICYCHSKRKKGFLFFSRFARFKLYKKKFPTKKRNKPDFLKSYQNSSVSKEKKYFKEIFQI